MRIDVYDPKYRIRAPGMDEQHQALFKAINRLHDGMIDGHARDILGTLFEQLVEYAAVHFKSEESLMANYRYPRLAEHRCEHRYFMARVKVMRRQWQRGKLPAQTFQIMEFLNEWITGHVLMQDKDYDRWIAETQSPSGASRRLS